METPQAQPQRAETRWPYRNSMHMFGWGRRGRRNGAALVTAYGHSSAAWRWPRFSECILAEAFSSPNGDSASPTLTEQKPVGHIATACICLDGHAEGAVTALRLLRPTAIDQPQGASRGFRSAYFAEAFSSPNGDSACPTFTEQKPVGHIATACICFVCLRNRRETLALREPRAGALWLRGSPSVWRYSALCVDDGAVRIVGGPSAVILVY